MIHQFFYPFTSGCRYWYHRYSQHLLHLVHKDGSTILSDLIHHVQCKYHWNFQLHQLHSQVEISFYVCCIYYIDYSFRFVFQQELPCNDLLTAVRRHGIYTRQICNQCIRMALYHPIFSIYSLPGEIAYMLAGTC